MAKKMVFQTIFPFEQGSLFSGGMVSFGDFRVKLGRLNGEPVGMAKLQIPLRMASMTCILLKKKNANGFLVKK